MAQRSKAKQIASTEPDQAETGGRMPLYLVYGEDEYLVSAKAHSIVDGLCPEADRAFGLEIVDGQVGTVGEAVNAVKRCRDALQTVGFLGGGKVVWLKGANFLAETIVGKSQDVKATVAELTSDIKAGLSTGQTLVISASKVDGRSAFFKACKEFGELAEFGVSEKSYQAEEQAKERALEMFRRAGLAVNANILDAFIGKVGFETRQIVQEVEKLAVYLNGRKEVGKEDIAVVTAPCREAITWDLADSIGKRDLQAAIVILRQLLFQGENAMGLIYGLENRFRELIIYRECMDRKWLYLTGRTPWQKAEWKNSPDMDQYLSALNKDPRQTNPFRSAKLAEQAQKFNLQELIDAHRKIVATHEQFVSSAVPAGLLLEFLILKLLGRESKCVVY